MRVLIADDSPVFRQLLQAQLTAWGYEPELACDGTAALAALEPADGPQLAILDWNMPGMSGPEVCRRVRASRTAMYVYVVLLTGHEPAGFTSAMDAGVDDFLTKPVQMGKLRARLEAGCRILAFERRARELFDAAPVAYHEADREGIVVRVNRAECQLLGFEADQILGRRIWDFVTPEQQSRRIAAFREVLESQNGTPPSEWEYIRSDRTVLAIEAHGNRIATLDGQVTGVRTTLLDVTHRRREAELLRLHSRSE